MQVSATLIAAQQAAREAQARFQAQHAAPPLAAAKPGFAAALGDSFSSPPLKQTAAPAQAAAQPQAQLSARLGRHVDITV